MSDLNRFLEAQASTYDRALAELTAGEKRSHWMWFIFPQLQGLGSSPTARLYAITGISEAADYLAHPSLGSRLRACTAAVNAHSTSTVSAIFGYPDDLKFHSSITLFAQAALTSLPPTPENSVFSQSLDLFFAGSPDSATLRLLRS